MVEGDVLGRPSPTRGQSPITTSSPEQKRKLNSTNRKPLGLLRRRGGGGGRCHGFCVPNTGMEAGWGPPRGRNTHSTQAWVEALGEGAKGILAAIV